MRDIHYISNKEALLEEELKMAIKSLELCLVAMNDCAIEKLHLDPASKNFFTGEGVKDAFFYIMDRQYETGKNTHQRAQEAYQSVQETLKTLEENGHKIFERKD